MLSNHEQNAKKEVNVAAIDKWTKRDMTGIVRPFLCQSHTASWASRHLLYNPFPRC